MTPSPFRHRYAAHLGFRSFDRPLFKNAASSADPVEQIRFAANLGLAGVFDPWFLSRVPDDRERVIAAIRETGLAAGTLVASLRDELRTPLWLPRSAEARNTLDRRLGEAIDAAQMLGSTILGVVPGRRDDMDIDAQEVLFVDTLRQAGARAQDHGMILAVEAISPHTVPGLLVTSFAQCERIVRAAGQDSVRAMYDTAHLQSTEGDLIGHFERAADIIGVVQIANHPGRTEPAVGEIKMEAVLRAVIASGHDWLIELEHLWSADDADTERAGIEWLRRVDERL